MERYTSLGVGSRDPLSLGASNGAQSLSARTGHEDPIRPSLATGRSGHGAGAAVVGLDRVRFAPSVGRLIAQAGSRPRTGHDRYEVAKRVLDVVGASLLIVLLAPLMLVVAAAIKLTSRGPVIFRHQRVGRGGVPFVCLKFRTMVADAEDRLRADPGLQNAFVASFKIRNDPRVTGIGRVLRRLSIDELPQLFNVLGGSMSLIGPRPLVQDELVRYGDQVGVLLRAKPGLGGLWQVCGRSDTSYAERVALDLLYVESRSLWLDLRLAVLTAFAVLRRRGAC